MKQLKISHQITTRDSLALDKYLQEISKLPLLSADQEVDLAIRIKAGEGEALDELTKANLRFVVSVAKQYQGQGLQLIDLINEGNVGLIKAAKRFDETKGFKFISYAVWWIRQAIMQALVEQSRLVRLPLNKVDAYQKLNKVLLRFLQENERRPSAKELSEVTDLTPKEIQELLKIHNRHVSIDAPSSEDEDQTALIHKIASNTVVNPDRRLVSESLKEEIREVLSILSTRESDIITNYFGLDGNSAMSLEDIALRFSLTRERVRQIKERAIRRLRKGSKSKELKSYLGQ